MATRTEWETAAEALIAAERERLGEPPTAAELDAFARGELSEADDERVRAFLVYGDDDGDDAPGLTPFALAHDRAEPRRWLRFAPMAASILLALSLVQSRVQIARLTHRANEPRLLAASHVLRPQPMTRSPLAGEPYVLPDDEETFVLELAIDNRAAVHAYRVELFDSSAKTIWRAPSVAVTAGDPLAIAIPRAFVPPGTYRVRADGLDDEGEWRRLGTYLIRTRR